MNRVFVTGIFLVASLVPRLAIAYSQDTHTRLSRAAFDQSVVNTEIEFLRNLGLDPSKRLPNSGGTLFAIPDLVRFGAFQEDEGIRALNHFFNPLNGSALTGVPGARPSPTWALEDTGPIDGIISAQEFSFNDARRSFHEALTLPDQAKREKSFGRTFETLGHVIHHVQDMAQPQHVRNDEHCDRGICRPLQRFHPSGYEAWTQQVQQTLPYTGYAPVYSSNNPGGFNLPRNFWATPNNAGIAQFTNLNFVSARTNFDANFFALPAFDPNLRRDVTIESLCAKANPPCRNPNLRGTMTFFGSWVEDGRTGQRDYNARASTESVFDPELTRAGRPRVFSLNRFNYDAAHAYLIPRAVAYSAGLINYFFRGKVDWGIDPDNPGQYLLKNLGPEQMSGDFALYYDAVDGKRYPASGGDWRQKSIQSAGKQTVMLDPPKADDPEPEKPGEYILVFRGEMGQEKPENGSVGAVAGKVVLDPLMIKVDGYYHYPDPVSEVFGFIFSAKPELVKLAFETGGNWRLNYEGMDYPCLNYKPGAFLCTDLSAAQRVEAQFEFLWDPVPWMNIIRKGGPSTLTFSVGNTVLFSFDFKGDGAGKVKLIAPFHIDAKGAPRI